MSAHRDLLERVRAIVTPLLPADFSGCKDDTELLISGLLDSMAVITVASDIESEFGIEVPAIDITIEHFESIAGMANYLAGRCSDGCEYRGAE